MYTIVNTNFCPFVGVVRLDHALALRDRAATHLRYLEGFESFNELAVLIVERVFQNDVIISNGQHFAAPYDSANA